MDHERIISSIQAIENRHFYTGNYQEAVFLLLDLKSQSDDTLIDIMLVQAYTRLEEWEKAAKVIENVWVRFNPESMQAYALGLSLSRCYECMGEYKRCLDTLTRMMRHFPQSVQVLTALGGALVLNKRYEDAFKVFETVTDMDSENARNLNNYAWALLESMGHNHVSIRRALAMSRAAVRQYPHSAKYLDSLARAYYSLGNMPSALEQLQHALAVEPANAVLLKHLGIIQGEKDWVD